MSSETAPSVVERVQDWVAHHKRAVLIGTAAAVIAAGGVAYYASTSARPRPADVEKAPKSKKKSKKKKAAKDADGPIIEERKATLQEEVEHLESVYTDAELATKSAEEKSNLAAEYKKRGNEAYSARHFGEAAELYTRAIRVSPVPQPVFYSNRAACYVNMSPPKNELVIADCDEALKLDPKYVKALNRRAIALEKLGRRVEALRDYSAAAILDNFQTISTAQAMERVLSDLAKDELQRYSLREPKLPSHSFTAAYFAAFRPRAHPALPEDPSTGDNTLSLALGALDAADYIHAVTLLNEAIEQGISTDAGKAEALNLRGTFKFLMGDVTGAKADLDESVRLVPSFTQSLVKIASVLMEQGEADKAFQCFEDAIKHNPNDPDIYYHRGQVLYIMNDFEEAAANYNKSIELDDQFVFSFIQLAVALYRKGDTGKSTATFRKVLKAFPERSEPHNYYGELLLDQGLFSEAVEKFEKAFELEKSKPRPNVLPLVNKALALFQWKQDLGGAERCCHEALRIDPECEAAVATVAQLYLQQRKVDEAVKMFEKHIEMARSEPELNNALTCKYNYPDVEPMQEMLAAGAR
ncbi:ADP/ATP carrier receptor [Cyathus striatus]|nr:ADP/ATP carrier receptor [Cyathus striatus]